MRAQANKANKASEGAKAMTTRRELALRSVNLLALGAMFTWGAAPTPSNIGLSDYGEFKSLSLCPPSPNCISTAEEANDMTHYVPQWTYNPEEGRGTKNPATQEQAMNELVEVVESTTPDGFTPKIVKRTADYLHVEYESPTFGFIDDFEAYFPANSKAGNSIVEYRSASRIGESDGDINRKRVRELRKALQSKGWYVWALCGRRSHTLDTRSRSLVLLARVLIYQEEHWILVFTCKYSLDVLSGRPNVGGVDFRRKAEGAEALRRSRSRRAHVAQHQALAASRQRVLQ